MGRYKFCREPVVQVVGLRRVAWPEQRAQTLAGADYTLTEHTSAGMTGRCARSSNITDEATWDLIFSQAPVQADGVTPFDTTQRFQGLSYLAVTINLKYYF